MKVSLASVGPFPLGVNNRREDHDLSVMQERSRIDLLRSATNVDLTDDGRVRRRQGRTLVASYPEAHSLWGHQNSGFLASRQNLYFLQDGSDASLIRTDLVPGQPMSYCEAGGTFFYTGSGLLGMVRGGEALDFPQRPNLLPYLTVVPGALRKGRYQICFTVAGPGGESPSTAPQAVVVPDGGGIRLDGVPSPPAGTALRAYMTAADGEVFGRIHLDVTSGTAEIVVMPSLGARCTTLLLDPMPPGSIVRHSNGRLLVATGNLLCYSEPFANGLFRASKNYIPFPEPITVVEPCVMGVWVVADQTYWIDGDITQAALLPRLPYGAIPHSSGPVPTDSRTVFWISTRGLVLGRADGAAENVQERQLALAGGAAGATLYREQEGTISVVTSVRDPMQTNAAASSYFDAEIVRKGVVL